MMTSDGDAPGQDWGDDIVLTGAYPLLEPDVGALVREVLGRWDPELDSRLAGQADVSKDDANKVEQVLYHEFVQHLDDDWEPTTYGKAVDYAIGAFVTKFLFERDPDEMTDQTKDVSVPRSALGLLDPESALVLRDVLTKCDPDLLAALEASDEPTREVREHVIDVVADEFGEHVSAPDWEPTPWGKRVDDALGWFLHRFPIES